METPRSNSISLSGLEDSHRSRCYFSIWHRERNLSTLGPHKVFKIWTKHFQLPWICFLEIALFMLYFIFSLFHQNGAVSFSLDFSKSITSYFLKDINLDGPPLGIDIGAGQIYFENDLYDIFNMTLQRFFTFSTGFPCAFPIIPKNKCKIEIFLQNKTTLVREYEEDEVDQAILETSKYFRKMDYIRASMVYHVQVESKTSDTRMNLDVLAEFTHDYDTDTIFMDIKHTRFQEKFDLSSIVSIFDTFDFSLPISICILNIITLIIYAVNTVKLYKYCKHKAKDSGQIPLRVFWSKYDKWDIFAIICNLVSIAASIMYLLVGQDIEEDLPPFLYLMAGASFLHAMLLIRYLELKPSTRVTMMVFYHSSVRMLEFLVGCVTVFIGVVCLTNCIFGTVSDNFTSGLQASAFLFCSMHGDSIKDFYDSMVLNFDVNYYTGFFTATIWILFSLTIMFNITISIVQEILSIEEYKASISNEKKGDIPIYSILSEDISLLSHDKKPI